MYIDEGERPRNHHVERERERELSENVECGVLMLMLVPSSPLWISGPLNPSRGYPVLFNPLLYVHMYVYMTDLVRRGRV